MIREGIPYMYTLELSVLSLALTMALVGMMLWLYFSKG
jgi:hypothetical protein